MEEFQQSSSAASQINYQDWLANYELKLKNMTEEELAKENHTDDCHTSQAYPDYLDYVEEWRWHHDEQHRQLTAAALFSLSKRTQRIQCQDHFHILIREDYTIEGEGEKVNVCFPRPNAHNCCWYQTISKTVKTHCMECQLIT